MSGLPDDFDERKRREVSEKTIVSPLHKMKQIEDIFRAFDREEESFGPKTVA